MRTKNLEFECGYFGYIGIAVPYHQANPISCNTVPVSAPGPTNQQGCYMCAHQHRKKKPARVKMAACGWGGCGSKLVSFAIKKVIWTRIYTEKENITIPIQFMHLRVILDWPHDIHTLRGPPVARDRGSAQWQVIVAGRENKSYN